MKAAPEVTTQVSRVMIAAPIQVVWDTLTQQGKVLPFFFGSVMHTTTFAPGSPIRMRTPNGKYDAVVGDVLELDPPHRFSMTFKFTTLDDPVCKITHELREVDGQTEYTLTAEQVPVGTKTEKNMKGGGKFIVNEVKRIVETGKPSWLARTIMISGKLTGFMTPKSCRVENWPMDRSIELPGT